MSIETLREYHVEAARKMHNYAEDDRLRPSDVKHYSKRAEFHEDCLRTIDSLIQKDSFESLYNAAIDERDVALKLTKHDFSLIGIVRVPPMEYDEP